MIATSLEVSALETTAILETRQNKVGINKTLAYPHISVAREGTPVIVPFHFALKWAIASRTKKLDWFHGDRYTRSALAQDIVNAFVRRGKVQAERWLPSMDADAMYKFHGYMDTNRDIRFRNLQRKLYIHKEEAYLDPASGEWKIRTSTYPADDILLVIGESEIKGSIKRVDLFLCLLLSGEACGVTPYRRIRHNFCRQSIDVRVARCLEVWQKLTLHQLVRGLKIHKSLLFAALARLLKSGVISRDGEYLFLVDITSLNLKPIDNPEVIRHRARQFKKFFEENTCSSARDRASA